MKCYIRRAIYIQRTSNPITEILFEDALEQAATLDVVFASTGEVVGRCKSSVEIILLQRF